MQLFKCLQFCAFSIQSGGGWRAPFTLPCRTEFWYKLIFTGRSNRRDLAMVGSVEVGGSMDKLELQFNSIYSGKPSLMFPSSFSLGVAAA